VLGESFKCEKRGRGEYPNFFNGTKTAKEAKRKGKETLEGRIEAIFRKLLLSQKKGRKQ